jgi:lipoate-protein ligase A
MSKLPLCRLIVETEPNAGAWNMAVDEVLLETAIREQTATLRWYRWSEPTLSLGYFQKHSEVDSDPQWSGVPRVRRLTGGGAILHQHEWTYSLALPARQALVKHPEELYDVVHFAVLAVLRAQGFSAALRGQTRKLANEPFLCFSRGDAHDVVASGHKILGSAQRRRKGAVLQHGSLLMRCSPFSPQHPGIEDLGYCGKLAEDSFRYVAAQLAERVELAGLTVDEWSAARRKTNNGESLEGAD